MNNKHLEAAMARLGRRIMPMTAFSEDDQALIRAEAIHPSKLNTLDRLKNLRKTAKELAKKPSSAVWGFFAAEKWDDRVARDFLLNFIESKGLDDELAELLDALDDEKLAKIFDEEEE